MKELRRNMRIVATPISVAFPGLYGRFAFAVFEQGFIRASDSHSTRPGAGKTQRGDIRDREATAAEDGLVCPRNVIGMSYGGAERYRTSALPGGNAGSIYSFAVHRQACPAV